MNPLSSRYSMAMPILKSAMVALGPHKKRQLNPLFRKCSSRVLRQSWKKMILGFKYKDIWLCVEFF